MSYPFIIGVAGGSGSGKSTVTRQVLQSIGADQAAIIVQDYYYCDQSQLSFEQRLKTNYDHPEAFDWPLLIEHIELLRQGQDILMPMYDFTRHTRATETTTIAAAPVIVIEGLFPLYNAALRELMSLKIFVDTDADVRFIRRLQRDVRERGRSADSVIEQYLNTVRPMHNQFVEPTKRFADVILPHGANDPAVDMICARLTDLIRSDLA
ncbi:uridine kinase [Neisseriaceae bacterium TC5R-5]|nr:uridine kinase [Neisseriaceae bacterium TC5R-5]